MVPKTTPATSLEPTLNPVLTLLRQRIRDGIYEVGQWLPAERLLAEEFGVHRRTVHTAIERLAQEGLVSLRSRCRPVVQPLGEQHPAPAAKPAHSPFPASRLVALIMWHGGFEQGATAQQRIFWGMNQRLTEAGYHGVFLDLGAEIGSEQENATREAARLRYALDHHFGGVIFYAYAYRRNRALIQEIARRVPLVLIDRMLPGVEADFVGTDNQQATYEATMHLLRQGHRRIAYVTKVEPINTVQDRLEGYRHALREAFGAEFPEMVLTATAWDGSAWSVFDTLFRLPADERPTAVLCVNDYEAVQVAQRLNRLNLRVPQDVALVGFDDIVQVLPGGTGLTTVAQPFEEIGRAAAQAFLDRRTAPEGPLTHQELPARLITRASSEAEVKIALSEAH